MEDKKEREPVNPKWLLRRISETLPLSLPEELVNMIIALYAHSNGWINKEDAECGRFEFSVTVPFSQLAKYTRLTSQGVKKRCERLRDDWKILSWVISANRNHGNDFSIRWEADQSVCPGRMPADGAASGGVLERHGGVPESQGGVLKGSGGVPARTPSVLSDLSGLSEQKTIAIAIVTPDQDKELKTAGETPATPTLSSNSESEFDESMSGFGEPVSFSLVEPVSSSPASTQDFAAIPSWETEPARRLANYLFCFLSVREDVEVPPGWEKFWTNDFQEALNSGRSLPDLKIAIRMSQFGKARKYYKRGASIVRNLELLVNDGQKLQERGLLATNPNGTSYRLPCGWDEDWVESLRLPSTPAQQACEKTKGHVWIDILHTTQQCSACGKLRADPKILEWTAADDLEAECLDFIENYDPHDPYSSASEESTPTSANRAVLSSSEFARATGAITR